MSGVQIAVDIVDNFVDTAPYMAGYTKLFNSILASTVWSEPMETRIVWITLLAMSDRRGIVEGSVPGLAVFARLPLEATRMALERLSGPDEDSRSKEQEGRRIEPVEGGWRLINHAKYRDKMGTDERREYLKLKQREYRHKQQRQHAVDNKGDKYTKLTHTAPAPSPTPDTRNTATPLPPVNGGRVTRDEWKHARVVRKNRLGCIHQPTCEDEGHCLKRIVDETRQRAAERHTESNL